MTRPREIEIFRGIYLTAISLDVLFIIAALVMMTDVGYNILVPSILIGFFTICLYISLVNRVASNHRGYIAKRILIAGFAFEAVLIAFLFLEEGLIAWDDWRGAMAMVFVLITKAARGIALGLLFTKNSHAWLYPQKEMTRPREIKIFEGVWFFAACINLFFIATNWTSFIGSFLTLYLVFGVSWYKSNIEKWILIAILALATPFLVLSFTGVKLLVIIAFIAAQALSMGFLFTEKSKAWLSSKESETPPDAA